MTPRFRSAFPLSASSAAARASRRHSARARLYRSVGSLNGTTTGPDRKSTRLNSSHLGISYAVLCLKKKTKVLPAVKVNTMRKHPERIAKLNRKVEDEDSTQTFLQDQHKRVSDRAAGGTRG